MSPAEPRKSAGIAPASFTILRRNPDVVLSVLLKIVSVLNYKVGDMMSFVKNNPSITSDKQQNEVL